MAIDLDRVRRETRAAEVLIHLNNAGASLPPAIVHDTIREHLRSEEVLGGYEALDYASEQLGRARAAVGQLVAGRPEEIAFTTSATQAWQSALYAMPWKAGDRIVASRAEYPSAAYSFQQLRERFGVEVAYVPDDASGQLDVEALRGLIDDRTRLIAVTHMPTYSGLINPVADVGAVARAAGVPFLLDACQTVGQLPIDVREIGCDMLAAAGRKWLRGPRGTGFLWVRREFAEGLHPLGGDQHSATWAAPDRFDPAPGARRLETFERSTALDLGLGAAARYALDIGLDEIGLRVHQLAAGLRGMLSQVPGVRVQDRGVRLGGIVTFTVERFASGAVAQALRARQVNVSVTPAGAAMLDFPPRGLTDVVRASPHYFVTEAELGRAADAVAEVAAAGEPELAPVRDGVRQS